MRHASTSFPIAICAVALWTPAFAQTSRPLPAEVEPALATIRPQAIRAHMRFLADDLLEGRRTATRGYDLAAKYVAAAFEALGLEPAGTAGSYFQSVPLVRMTMVEPECSLDLLREGGRIPLRQREDYISGNLAEPESSVTAPVVFVGFGVTAPELGYDDYAGIDVRGKIVALLAGAPPSFPHNQRAYYSDSRIQMRNAVSRGAVGVLAILTPELERIAPWELIVRETRLPSQAWMDEAGRPARALPEIRGSALLSRKGADALFAGAPRSLEEVFKTAEAGQPQAFELPVQASLRTVNRHERTESPNVAAVLRGSDPRLREEYVVLTAHLDHLGVGEPVAGDAIYNGAYDNAAGVAVLLEVADALAQLPVPPRRSVLFLAVTGEEQGLNGSEYFARHPTVPIERVVADVNLDMFLMLYPLRDVIAFGAEHSSLGPTVEEAAGKLGIEVSPDPIPEQVVFIRSDQYAFVQQGVPAVFLIGGWKTGDPAVDGRALWSKWMQEVYHHPGDDMSQAMDFGAGAQFAKLNFLITYLAAQADRAPSWNPGDFFGEKFRRQPPPP
jgi:peptidase M28-like protein